MNDFAASPGQVSDLSSSGLSNSFSDLPSNNVDSAFNSDRVQPRQVATGVTRGTQKVGYGGVEIDGAHDRITFNTDETRITLGDTSDTDDVTGIALTDTTTNKKLASLGRDTSTTNAVTGLTAYDGTGTRRLHAGTFPDGSVKVKLSQTTHDVATATDDQLIWSSDFNMFKIKAPEITTLVTLATGGTYSITVPHTIGGRPAVLAYVELTSSPGQFVQLPYTIVNVSGTAVGFSGIAQYVVTDTDIRFVVSVDNSIAALVAGSWNFKYYLMVETAS